MGLVLVSFIVLPCKAENAMPTTSEIITRLSEAAKQLKSFSAKLVQRKYFFLFNEEEVSSGKIFFESPDKMLINIEKPKTQILGCDGKKGWLYLPDIKQVQMMSIEGIKNRGASFMKFLINPSQYLQESNLSLLQVIQDGKDRILKLKVSNIDEKSKDADFLNLILWINESRPLPVMKLELTEACKDTVLYELSHVVYNPQFQPSLLKPSFPEGVEIVDY
ncbi:MAG: hypothetical protein A2161_04420 [Candidatus Schekmanbacteria bacterium RBG_13_48_7]|uniref:Outer membrane lipoprotein carrier protein LolA n=1 Tax=Candidatus Schekmanbacteria bacterium RBG_13_48_7 TaxID=1817878 RepID=A0A1F7S4D7_9BACT|nr:MAG: hypothetical protein A2161_04420 [Candidatus Schekmanbacteria bacterium RBG_13_48_7]